MIEIPKAVNAWESLPSCDQSIVLIGFSNTGKSTFAELINKYVFLNENHLKFEKDKYILEGVISAKSIKIQTTVPQLYFEKGGHGLAILDSPCYILTT
jgi:ribosome-interacting GTPase 1